MSTSIAPLDGAPRLRRAPSARLDDREAPAASAWSFAGWLVELINGGALAVMISVGHRAGLFDTLAEHTDMSLDELVELTEFDAVELLAWLEAMVVGGLVEQDPSNARYRLPDAHAAALCRNAGSDNLAILTQYVGLLGRSEDELLAKLRGPAAGRSSSRKARAGRSPTRSSSAP